MFQIIIIHGMCPTTCMQPCNHNLFSIVKEEESIASHDTMNMAPPTICQKIWSSKSMSSLKCLTLPYVTLLRISPKYENSFSSSSYDSYSYSYSYLLIYMLKLHYGF